MKTDEEDDWGEAYTQRTIRVYCTQCKKERDETTVAFLDISEDPQGRDLMTFECVCGTKQQSLRFG